VLLPKGSCAVPAVYDFLIGLHTGSIPSVELKASGD
jgi:hypothetical protein